MSGAPWAALVALAAAEVRRNWRSLVALGVLIGLGGAAVIAAASGARRTATAHDRLREATRIDDARVMSINAVRPEALRGLPHVITTKHAAMGVGEIEGPEVAYIAIQSLPPEPDDVFTPVLVSGRLYRAGAPDEAVMTERAARRQGIRPGAVVRLKMLAPPELLQFATGFGQPDGPVVELRITGLVRVPGPVIETAPILTSPALAARYPDAMSAGDITYLRLRDGARSVPAVQRAIDRLGSALPRTDSPLPPLQLLRPDDGDATIRTTARVLTRGLLVFVTVVGGVGLLTVALAFVRYHAGAIASQHVEAALGLTATERVGARVLAGSLSALVGVVVCVAGALIFAGMAPLGPLERSEPHPGWAPNMALIAAGAVATAAATLGLVAFAATRAGRPESVRVKPVHMWRLPGAPWLTTGVRFALEGGSGRRRVPVRSSLAGVVVGVLGVLGCSVFAASRDELVANRARWGWSADLAILNTTEAVVRRLTADERLQDVSVARVTQVRVGDADVTGYALTPVKGSLGWTTPTGRTPTGSSEVTLGRRLAERLAIGVGNSVRVAGPSGDTDFSVVGVGYGPSLARDHFGDNLLFSTEGLDRVARASPDQEALVRSRPGTNVASLTRELSESFEIAPPEQPPEVSNLAALGRLPSALGACLAVIAAAALSHLLIVTARRRARELTILRVLGFTPRQAGSSILVMAVTTAMVGAGAA